MDFLVRYLDQSGLESQLGLILDHLSNELIPQFIEKIKNSRSSESRLPKGIFVRDRIPWKNVRLKFSSPLTDRDRAQDVPSELYLLDDNLAELMPNTLGELDRLIMSGELAELSIRAVFIEKEEIESAGVPVRPEISAYELSDGRTYIVRTGESSKKPYVLNRRAPKKRPNIIPQIDESA